MSAEFLPREAFADESGYQAYLQGLITAQKEERTEKERQEIADQLEKRRLRILKAQWRGALYPRADGRWYWTNIPDGVSLTCPVCGQQMRDYPTAKRYSTRQDRDGTLAAKYPDWLKLGYLLWWQHRTKDGEHNWFVAADKDALDALAEDDIWERKSCLTADPQI